MLDIGEVCTRDSECTTPFSRCEQLYQSCSGSCVCSDSYYAFSPTECRPGKHEDHSIHVFQFIFNSYVYFRHKKSIYNKIYIQLNKIYIRICNNAIRAIRTKKGDFKENIFIMLQCRTTNSKCLRRLELRSHK